MVGDTMFESYEIRKQDGEEVLVLFCNFDYEFSMWKRNRESSFLEQVMEYIEQQKIRWNGRKIVLVVGGIALASMFYPVPLKKDQPFYHTPYVIEELVQGPKMEILEEEAVELPPQVEAIESLDSVKKEEMPVDIPKEEITPSAPEPEIPTMRELMVTIHRTNGNVVTMTLERYIIGVVAAEMPASFSIEALKAQAVVARTYTLRKVSRGEMLTDSVQTQAYLDESQLRALWGNDYDHYYQKIEHAVLETKGVAVRYQGDYIDAVYHSMSNGRTEAAVQVWGNEVPYLQSVDSSWDQQVTSYQVTQEKELQLVMNLLGVSFEDLENIEIMERNSSGRVVRVRIGGQVYQGTKLRSLLGLRSTDFDLEFVDGRLTVTTRGYGHGVGMSQHGANEMAKNGFSYEQIIKHYYTGVSLQSSS